MSNLSNHHLSIGSHYEIINGNVLHYKVSGKGPVCIFPTPGWGPSIELYTGSMHPFEHYYTMVWLDTRMSGLSSGPQDPMKYTSRDFAEDLEALRIHLGLDKVWLIGQSLGAYQILQYATLFNERLNGIVAVSATAGRDSISAAMYRSSRTSYRSHNKIFQMLILK
jgi:proline iminopeptidase